jgi:periplasmic divalent cation tolerance protein
MTDKIVVLVTCANRAEAKRIGRALVEARLGACANILTAPVHSVYRWKGKVETAEETLMLIKTSRKQFPRLRDKICSLHSYEVPEIIALPVAGGLGAYLAWIGENVGRQSKPRTRRRKRRKK